MKLKAGQVASVGISIRSLATGAYITAAPSPGFHAEMARFPDEDLTVIVLTNADNGQPEQIANVVAAMYFAAP